MLRDIRDETPLIPGWLWRCVLKNRWVDWIHPWSACIAHICANDSVFVHAGDVLAPDVVRTISVPVLIKELHKFVPKFCWLLIVWNQRSDAILPTDRGNGASYFGYSSVDTRRRLWCKELGNHSIRNCIWHCAYYWLIVRYQYVARKISICEIVWTFRNWCTKLSVLLRKPEYSGRNKSIPWLLIPWLLASPVHQKPLYSLCRINRSLSFMRKDSNKMRHINIIDSFPAQSSIVFHSISIIDYSTKI